MDRCITKTYLSHQDSIIGSPRKLDIDPQSLDDEANSYILGRNVDSRGASLF